MRILHIAPFNFSGVPIELVKAERTSGHYSRLITLGRDPRGYEEDICLGLPFLRSTLLSTVKKVVSRRIGQTNVTPIPSKLPPVWRPKTRIEALLITLRNELWKRDLRRFLREFDFFGFDLYQLDGGHGLLRSGELLQEVKRRGKRIICCYLGSDLRLRGVIPEIDKLSDLNVTVEFDHLKLHPRIQHIFYPFQVDRFRVRESENELLRIAHAPTSRKAKGTDIIVSVVSLLEKEYPVKLVLIEGLSYSRALELKYTCDIMIDQLGELGYGMNSLEALAMGIPTCTSLPRDYEAYLGAHPFINVNPENLRQKLVELIENRKLRRKKAAEGRRWVEAFHDSRKVVMQIHSLL
nr:MAG: hypothetical protein AM324_03640 [Candidatus Thorarchaeota archaeon SMTZ1-83]